MKPSDYTGSDGKSRSAPFYVKESAKWTTEDVDKLGDFLIMQCEHDSSGTVSTASLYIIRVPDTYEGHEFLLIHDSAAFVASERCMEEEKNSTRTQEKKKRKKSERLFSVKIKCIGIGTDQGTISTLVDIDLQPAIDKADKAKELRTRAKETLDQAEALKKEAEALAKEAEALAKEAEASAKEAEALAKEAEALEKEAADLHEQVSTSRKRKNREDHVQQKNDLKKQHFVRRAKYYNDKARECGVS
jgi:hypothetical protein